MNCLLQWLAGNLLIVTAVAAILWPLSKMSALRNRPALRHSLWLLVLVKLVTPPLVTVPVPMPTTHEVVMSSTPIVVTDLIDEDISVSDLPAPFRDEFNFDNDQAVVIAPVESHWTWPEVAAGLGLLSLFVTSLFWLIAAYQIRKICRLTGRFPKTTDRAAKILERVAAEFKLKKCPTLVVADAACSPMLWVTWRRATILLPRTFEQSVSDEQLRHVLAHEVAHLVRRDHLSSLVAFFVTSLFWFCPIAWLAWRETHIAMEACCDALVLDRLGGSRRSYAQTLLAAIDFAATHKSASPVLAARFGESHSLRRRVEMIANMEVKATLSHAGRFAVLSCGLVALTLLPVWAEEKPVQVTEVVQEERPTNSQATVTQSARIGTRPPIQDRDLLESPAESDGEQAETPVSQIKISGKIVEVDHTKLRKLGIDWSFDNEGVTSLTVLGKDPEKKLKSLMELGAVKVHIAPQLTTISGRAASIKKGEMQLKALPQLQKDGTIRLQFRIERSVPINAKKVYKQSVDSEVTLQSRQTISLGGLRQTQTTEKGDKRDLEMIVLITAELVDSKAELDLQVTAKSPASEKAKTAPAAPPIDWKRLVRKSEKSRRERESLIRLQGYYQPKPLVVNLTYIVLELDYTKARKLAVDVSDVFSRRNSESSLINQLASLEQLKVVDPIYFATVRTPLGKLSSGSMVDHRQCFPPKLRSVPTTDARMSYLPRLGGNGVIGIEFRAEWDQRYSEKGVDKKGLNSMSTTVGVRSGEPVVLGGTVVTQTNEQGEKRNVENVVLILAELELLERSSPQARNPLTQKTTGHNGTSPKKATQSLLKLKGLAVKTEPVNKDAKPSEADIVSISGGEAITDEVLARFKALPKLRELRLEFRSTVTPAGLAHLANLTSLEKLSLDRLFERGDAALQSISRIESLRELNIVGCSTTDAGIEALESMPQLTHLSLQNEGSLTDAALTSIAKLKRLKYLRLPSAPPYSKPSRFSPAAIRQLSDLHELDEFNLGGHPLPGELLPLPKLTSLRTFGTKLSEATAAEIAACPNLRSLELQSTGINSAAVKQIAAMENLRHLKIGSRQITDADLKQITTMKNLRRLEIQCRNITAVGLAQIKGMLALNHLTLRGLAFTDESLRSLSEIESLTRLELHGNSVFTVTADKKVIREFSSIHGLRQLKALPNLRELNLVEFELPDAHLDLKELKQLDRLTLRAVEISDEELAGLARSLPGTKIVTSPKFAGAVAPIRR